VVDPVPAPFWIPLLISWRGKEKILDGGCGAVVVVVDDVVLIFISVSLQLSSLLNDGCCWSKLISFRAFSISYASSKRYSKVLLNAE